MVMPAKVCSISIDEAWCKKCVICVDFCPRKVFATDTSGQIQVVNPEACTGCLICELLCPELAISVAVLE